MIRKISRAKRSEGPWGQVKSFTMQVKLELILKGIQVKLFVETMICQNVMLCKMNVFVKIELLLKMLMNLTMMKKVESMNDMYTKSKI